MNPLTLRVRATIKEREIVPEAGVQQDSVAVLRDARKANWGGW